MEKEGKMKIPKTLKIGGRTYQIIIRNRSKDDGVNAVASANSFFQKIFIDSDFLQEGKESALIHEIMESINGHNDLRMEHQSLQTLSEQLYQVLKDNKLLKEDK